MPGKVRFDDRNRGTKNLIAFNGRNTQFASIYFPTYRLGYESWLCALLDWLVPDNGVFIDAGSNWGYFGLYLSSRPKFAGQIYSFEPFPETFADLISVVTQAGVGDGIRCLQVALSNQTGFANMKIPNGFESGLAQISGDGGVSVRISKLDELPEIANSPRLDFVKIDVEGSELDVLKGAAETIQAHQPMIVVESWKYRDNAVRSLGPLNLLAQMGYELFLPCWSGEIELGSFFEDQDREPIKSSGTLNLVPLNWRERLLYPERINVFACSAAKVGQLRDSIMSPD